MESTLEIENVRPVEFVADFANNQVHRWLDFCYQFRNWERQEMLLGNPTPEKTQQHRKSLCYILKVTRMMTNLAADPETFDHSVFSDLQILERQLEDSWEQFYNPMPPEEVEKLLKHVFPE